MRIQALTVAAGTVTAAAFGDVPVLVAVRRVAVLAESGVVVEPGGMDPGEGQRRLERDGDLPGLAGVNGVAAESVPGGDPQ